MTNTTNPYGLVLAGGRSSRMGVDKRTLTVHRQPQQDHLFALLCQVCEKVYISCKDEQLSQHLPTLIDQFEVDSPLNGILTALNFRKDTAWLMVAVDMPFADEVTFNHLILNRDPDSIATCYNDSDNQLPDPMLALWEPAAAPLVMAYHQAGNTSPRKFLMQHKVKILNIPEARALINVNTPEQLDQAKQLQSGIS